jgi:hypothetical protein
MYVTHFCVPLCPRFWAPVSRVCNSRAGCCVMQNDGAIFALTKKCKYLCCLSVLSRFSRAHRLNRHGRLGRRLLFPISFAACQDDMGALGFTCAAGIQFKCGPSCSSATFVPHCLALRSVCSCQRCFERPVCGHGGVTFAVASTPRRGPSPLSSTLDQWGSSSEHCPVGVVLR